MKPNASDVFIPPMWQTNDANVSTFAFWRDYLISQSTGCFLWEGLPEEIDARFMEMTLLFNGCGGIFSPVDGTFAFSPFAYNGRLDLNYNPVNVRFISVNGSGSWNRFCQNRYVYSENTVEYSEKDSVILFDNIERIPLIGYINLYARTLSEYDDIMRVNANAQTTPWIARCNDTSLKDTFNKVNQITGHEPVIVEDFSLADDSSISVYKTDAPYVIDKLQDAQEKTLNTFLSMIGVNNNPVQKRERTIEQEENGNSEQIMIMRNSRYNLRKKFCEECNELFGFDISVSWVVNYEDGNPDMGDLSENDGMGDGDFDE